MYKRFELYCGDDAQDIGLLMGVDELDADDDEKEALVADFNKNMYVPEFYMQANPSRDVLAFFTEHGVEYFQYSINKLINKFHEQGLFSVAEVTVPEEGQEIVYKDNFQVLIKNPKDKSVVY